MGTRLSYELMKHLLILITTAMAVNAFAAPSLLHRWSFNGDANDSVGEKHARLEGNVTYVNDNTAVDLAGGGKGSAAFGECPHEFWRVPPQIRQGF